MNNRLITGFAASVLLATPAVAAAQDKAAADAFVLASAGYHSFGIADDVEDETGLAIDDASLIYGVAAGVDFPIATNAFFGVEGNFHLGNDVIDSDYGVSARLGFKAAGGTKIYARGGYQWVNLDPAEFVDDSIAVPPGTFDDVDDTGGDYLVGAGVDIPAGNLLLRANVDTMAFDTFRATVGVGFAF